ncbi:MAG: dipeptide epimerase [Candidatus Marinimicrobia bacterium]|nr:dipeptide epimerase [Candidatus Neomarinimicrobiota bacterium]
MKLSFTTFRINCTHPFGISRSSHDYYDIVYVYLEGEGVMGRGEAAPSARYNEFTEGIMKVLEDGISLPDSMTDPVEFSNHVLPQSKGIKSLEVALSMAILDWWCQKEGISLFEYVGANPEKTPKTSFTISIGDMGLIPEKVAEASPYHILKIKLGMGENQDKAIMNAIRAETDTLIRVDANEGWDLDTGIKMCKWLAERNVEFVEQPFKSTNLKDTAALREKSPLPLIADENSLNSGDIPGIHGVFDGINIKLMKCGNLFEAMKMVKMARERDMSIMLGCMIESSIGITAAAHLSPLVDYADLDGNLLINNDPYLGVTVENGKLVLPKGNGLGVSLNSNHNNLM